jgi:hypothetical protein
MNKCWGNFVEIRRRFMPKFDSAYLKKLPNSENY